jgi:hypothetical protein
MGDYLCLDCEFLFGCIVASLLYCCPRWLSLGMRNQCHEFRVIVDVGRRVMFEVDFEPDDEELYSSVKRFLTDQVISSKNPFWQMMGLLIPTVCQNGNTSLRTNGNYRGTLRSLKTTRYDYLS